MAVAHIAQVRVFEGAMGADRKAVEDNVRAEIDAHLAALAVRDGGDGEIVRAPTGKRSHAGKHHISIAHTFRSDRYCAAVAASRTGPLGVDCELPRPIRLPEPKRARMRIAAGRAAPWPAWVAGVSDAELLQAWVRLEALAKVDGRGIGRVLEPISRPPPGSDGLDSVVQLVRALDVRIHEFCSTGGALIAVAAPASIAVQVVGQARHAWNCQADS